MPPYFHGSLGDPERYQTLFAKTVGSAAAPTAALHFTPRLMSSLTNAGVTVAEIELDVGLGVSCSEGDDALWINDWAVHRLSRMELGASP